MLLYFVAIWYILLPFGIYLWPFGIHFVAIWYFCRYLVYFFSFWDIVTRKSGNRGWDLDLRNGVSKVAGINVKLKYVFWILLSQNESLKNRGPFLTSPIGANIDPRGEFVPQKWILSPGAGSEAIPCGWNYLFAPPFFYINNRECSPLGVNKVVNIPPRGQISPLGARGEVKNGSLALV
jgi:hypothetical protein